MTATGDSKDGAAREGAGRWAAALPDAVAFASGLGIAMYLGWTVRDLVWSLWLSSLLVGYAIIVFRIFGPAFADLASPAEGGGPLGGRIALAAVRVFGGLFLLAFFTAHFGMFHFIHSIFLNYFFPAMDNAPKGVPRAAVYLHVLRAYWPFVLVAAVSERDAFRVRRGAKSGDGFMDAYTNVLRMHLLIFFFFFAHVAKLENYAVFAVVCALYFFPWSLLRRPKASPPGAGSTLSPAR